MQSRDKAGPHAGSTPKNTGLAGELSSSLSLSILFPTHAQSPAPARAHLLRAMHTPSTLASGGARTAPPPPPARRCTRSPASHASALAPKPRSSVAVAVARRSSVAPVAATAEIVSGPFCDLEVDTVLAKELAENGERERFARSDKRERGLAPTPNYNPPRHAVGGTPFLPRTPPVCRAIQIPLSEGFAVREGRAPARTGKQDKRWPQVTKPSRPLNPPTNPRPLFLSPLSRLPLHPPHQDHLHHRARLLRRQDAGRAGHRRHERRPPQHVPRRPCLAQGAHPPHPHPQQGERVREDGEKRLLGVCLWVRECGKSPPFLLFFHAQSESVVGGGGGQKTDKRAPSHPIPFSLTSHPVSFSVFSPPL